ncbi:hypothetical protein JCM6882_001414 [Rhodosporidiobolus microsporus]
MLGQLLNLIFLAALIGCSAFYYAPAYESGTLWNDLGSKTHLVGVISSGIAFLLFLLLWCSKSAVLAVVTLIVAAVDIACWITSAVSGTTSYLCDGAVSAVKAADAISPAADWIQCQATWIKYPIYVLIGLSTIFQVGAVFGSLPCWAKAAVAPAAVVAAAELGKGRSSRARRRGRRELGGAGIRRADSRGRAVDEEAQVPLKEDDSTHHLVRKMEKLLQEFKSMSMTSIGDASHGGVELAKRPDAGGKLGREIQLCANLYKIKFKQSPSIAHYDVTIIIVRDKDSTTRSGAPAPGGGSLNREVTNAVWDALVRSNPEGLGPQLDKAGFDCRKNAFSLGKLFPNGSKTFPVELEPETPNRPARRFEVKLQLAQLLDLSILETFCAHRQAANLSDSAAVAIMALDVLLRHSSFRQQNFVIGGAGRRFLDKSQSTPLGEGAHMLAGLFQSVRPTSTGMVVNLDTSYSPFIVTGKLREVCNAIVGRATAGAPAAGRGGRGGFRGGRGGRGGGFGGAGGRPDAGPAGRGPVRVTHREDKRPFMIKGFGQLAGQHKITIDDRKKKTTGPKPSAKEVAEAAARGQKIPLQGKPAASGASQSFTVAEYFKKQYNKSVDPNMQVVELRGGQFVPIECLELLHGCAIPPTKLSANQATAMINVAAKPPAERRAAIAAIRRDADFGPSSRPAAWGLEVDQQMMQLKGRVLPPPKVQYRAGPKANPFVSFGAWNLKDLRLLEGGKPLEHWAVAVFADKRYVPETALKTFFDGLVNQARLRGMTIKNNHRGFAYQDNEDSFATLKKACNLVLVGNPLNPRQVPPQVIFVVLQDPKRYDDIKKTAAFKLPVAVPTQVLLVKKVMEQRGVDQYQANCCLKLNAKLGGVNSTVAATDVPAFKLNKTLILGADVTHPTGFGTARAGSGEEVPPSIAAVVGSTDPMGMKYGAQVREQEGRKEFITAMEEMTIIHVKNWMKGNKNVKPETVLMFRDGVSEGQYAPVVQEEVTALKAAFRAIDPNWQPKLTYVVCAKRHNVRLFAANPNNTQDVDRTGNLPPGVVVDTSITHPFVFDFFLQAHAGLKGTAKPTRYIVLLDENHFSSDALQKTLNSLCYGYARATRSVSLVPAAYYADIVAGKARSYVTDDDASTTASGVARARARDSDFIQKQLDREFKGNPGAMGQTMWFV